MIFGLHLSLERVQLNFVFEKSKVVSILKIEFLLTTWQVVLVEEQ